MRRWPWVTIALTLVLALNPLGLDMIRSAFWASEQLARNIWQPLVLACGGVLAALALVEYLVRELLARRRASRATAASERSTET